MIQIVKRGRVSTKEQVLVKLLAVVLAFAAIGIFLLFLNLNPLGVYKAIVEGSLSGAYNIRQTIIKAIPIGICALGLSIAFRMNFWNIGAEGQMMLGGIGACLIGIFAGLEGPAGMLVMCVTAMLLGGLWAFIPAVFKVKWRTNETIMTLMFNYIGLKLVTYLQYVAWKDPKALGFPKIADFPAGIRLPSLFGINIGWIIALVIMVMIYLYMNKSKLGYESAVIGNSESTAKYIGMNTKKTILMTIFISGAICGLAGAIQASTVNRTLSTEFTQNAGNLAIIVAWVGALNPFVMTLISLLFAALIQGGDYIQMIFEISPAISEIIQATVLFFVLGSEFFLRYHIRIRKKTSDKEARA